MSLKPIPAEPTHAQRVTAAANAIRAYQLAAYKRLEAIHKDGMRLFWQAGHGVDPAEIAAELGTEATLVFVRSAAVKDCVAAFDAEDAIGVPPEWACEFHQDGTVTITPVE